MELLQILHRETQCEDRLICGSSRQPSLCDGTPQLQTWIGLDMLQMFLDQDRSFKRASGEFALRVAICILWGGPLFLLHANEHFREKEAFELLPRLPVFADSHSSIEPQSPKSTLVSEGAILVVKVLLVEHTFGNPVRASCQPLCADLRLSPPRPLWTQRANRLAGFAPVILVGCCCTYHCLVVLTTR